MKIRPLLIGFCLLTLAACGAKSSVLTYRETVNMADPSKVMAVIQASERVLTRRLAGADVQGAIVTAIPTDSGSATVTLKLPNGDAVATAQRILSDPFTFEIKIENGTIKNADGTEQTDWKSTGLDGSMLTWVSEVSSSAGEVGVELQFNDVGHQKLAEVFQNNKGKNVGVFVRDLLVSKLTVGTDKIGESIVISGIPSSKVAGIFADDVNVGLHATFTPAQ